MESAETKGESVMYEGPGVPDMYVDSIASVLGPYGITLYLHRQDYDVTEGSVVLKRIEVVGKVRMSVEHAWVFLQSLTRLMDDRVKNIGPIYLPKDLVDGKGLREVYDEMHQRSEE